MSCYCIAEKMGMRFIWQLTSEGSCTREKPSLFYLLSVDISICNCLKRRSVVHRKIRGVPGGGGGEGDTVVSPHHVDRTS